MTFPAQQLRAARKARNLTQQQAAALTNGVVTTRAWQTAERGENQPLWHRACAMLEAAGVDVLTATRQVLDDEPDGAKGSTTAEFKDLPGGGVSFVFRSNPKQEDDTGANSA